MKHFWRPIAFAVMVVLCANPAMANPNLMPSVSTAEAANKTIVIKNTTRSVHVVQNDTVLFKVGDRQFAIKFDGNNSRYNLQMLAPPGFLSRRVNVYVAPNPLEYGKGIP